MDFFCLLQDVLNLCKSILVAFLCKCVFGAFENKPFFFHNLTDSRFAQQDSRLSGHVCPYPRKGPNRKRIAHLSRVGLGRFDKLCSIIDSGNNRSAGTRIVVKSLAAFRFEQIEPIVDTLPVASKYLNNLGNRIAHGTKPNCLCSLANTMIRPTAVQFFNLLMFCCSQVSDKSLWPRADILPIPLKLSGVSSVKPHEYLKTFYRQLSRKTRKSMGTRPVSAVIIEELKKYLNGFNSEQHKLFDDNFNYKRWKKICKKAGLFDLRFHDLRKTFGSVLAQNGISTAVTQRLLEHSSPYLTNKVYTNVDPVLRYAVEQIPISNWL